MNIARFLLVTISLVAISLGFAAGAIAASKKPGLKLNGQVVVPSGQVDDFDYVPGSRQITIQTFFGDIRCTPGDQVETGNLKLDIDRIGDSEIAASYQVFDSGTVEYDLSKRMIRIQTSSNGQPGCLHQFTAVGDIDAETGVANPDTFWISDFSGPINITSNSTGTLAVGGRASITFTLTNDSGVVVATGFGADLVSSLPLELAKITECQPSDVPATINQDPPFAVSIPVLWPGESCTIEVAYDLTGVPAGETIETTLSGLNAMNRSGTAQLELGVAEFAVVNTTTAP